MPASFGFDLRHALANAGHAVARAAKGTVHLATNVSTGAIHVVSGAANTVLHLPVIHPVSKWVGNAALTAGRPIGSGLGAVNHELGKVDAEIRKVPVVGGLFHAIWDVEFQMPIAFAQGIVTGQNVSQVALKSLKDAVADVRTMAPYLESVIALVPGIGPPASAAIATGLALAAGEKIDQALLDGACALVPGGQLAKAALQVGYAAMHGKVHDFTQLGVALVAGVASAAGVPVPQAAVSAITGGLKMASDVATGHPLQQSVLDGLVAAIPNTPASLKLAARTAANVAESAIREHGPSHPKTAAAGAAAADAIVLAGQNAIPGLSAEQKKQFQGALTIGGGLGHAALLQGVTNAAVQAPSTVTALAQAGADRIATDPTLAHAAALLPAAAPAPARVGAESTAFAGEGRHGMHGFRVGAGLMLRGCNRYEVRAVRDSLEGDDVGGFDLAVSTHIGRVTNPIAAPSRAEPGRLAAYYATRGMRGQTPDNQAALVGVLAHNPNGRRGAAQALQAIARAKMPWWRRWWGAL